MLTADGLSVKVSLTVAARTADPRRWYEAVDDADGFLYAALQIALREAVGARSLDELLAARGSLPDDLGGRVAGSVEAVGVAIDSLALRDVMVPAELRRAAAEVATARAQGQTALERARSEVAATRALANAARLVAEQPALLQLRTLQPSRPAGRRWCWRRVRPAWTPPGPAAGTADPGVAGDPRPGCTAAPDLGEVGGRSWTTQMS